MARLFLVPGLLAGFLLLFWLWALFDVIMTDSLLIRNMQKGTWIFLVLIVPIIGAVAWVLLGRPEGTPAVPGSQVGYRRKPSRSQRRPLGAEDGPRWLGPSGKPSRPSALRSNESLAIQERKLMEEEAEQAKRERQNRGRESDESDPAD